MPELQVIARHTMRPGTETEVLALLAELIAAARTEPGNLAFDAYRDVDEPRSYVLLERYASRDAFAAHRETDHFKDIVLERLVQLLERRTVEALDA
jgi:quinol monooxygenase YgiN